ncbi:SLAP domain-containing protein [Halalkalibacter krulwichiae]|uniref:Lipoprotein n=1 Tax=Halalkalibacter krulwichiae TaxID=199441 RepID=A0A1X9MEX0_9BACI|nr:SLAP domain-containing protein [Halalkalibacter krulwichiae]ARK31995.1 hypothetical protein BkAM31D_20290 [Halalkalibacter krulwichiae]
MRKLLMRYLIVAALIVVMGACANTTATSTSLTNEEELEERIPLDPKTVHRLEQRGYEPLDVVEISPDTELDEEEIELSPVEMMTNHKGWTQVELILDEDVERNFAEQTIQYFIEDHYEKYPPPKNKTIDVIASLMYEDEDQLVLHGLIRNGYQDQKFKRKDLTNSRLELVTQNGLVWIDTTFKEATGFDELGSSEAKPFELRIPIEDVLLPEFDLNYFSYYANFEYKEVKKKEKKSKKESKED